MYIEERVSENVVDSDEHLYLTVGSEILTSRLGRPLFIDHVS